MEKYNEMREDGALFSWAESVEFAERAVQANLRDQTAEAKRIGKLEGIEEGVTIGLEQGLETGKKASLKLLLLHKYGVDDAWADTLSNQQVDDAVLHILDCDTYELLKDKVREKK